MADRIEELDWLLGEIEYFMREAVEELANCGVSVKRPDESGRHRFSAKTSPALAKIAQAAHEIAVSYYEHHIVCEQLKSLRAKLSGIEKSKRKRVIATEKKQLRVRKAYAELAGGGEGQIQTKLITRLQLSRSIVTRAITALNKEIAEAAGRLRIARPAMTHDHLVAEIVKRFATSTAGINEATVRLALKRRRTKKTSHRPHK